jgi:Putative lysophospholipase.
MKMNDLSFLDQPWILRLIFHPRIDPRKSPVKNAEDHFIEVEDGISIGCRFHVADPDCPTIIYFHGNGETVGDYDSIAPFYNRMKINLFVTDYRGYGLSGGEPTVTNMLQDARVVFEAFDDIIKEGGYNKNVFIMGRSLGSIPAVELESLYPTRFEGMIIESGLAGVFCLSTGLSTFLPGLNMKINAAKGIEEFSKKIGGIHLPTLIIHAQNDHLVPLIAGRELYDRIPSKDKRLFIVPNADHNTLISVGWERYFKIIGDFVFGHI